jgi:hypothetical protein
MASGLHGLTFQSPVRVVFGVGASARLIDERTHTHGVVDSPDLLADVVINTEARGRPPSARAMAISGRRAGSGGSLGA